MKIFCNDCKEEFDWNEENIFILPYGTGFIFRCRNCLKNTRAYKKDKIKLKK